LFEDVNDNVEEFIEEEKVTWRRR